MNTIDCIKTRRSIRKFKQDKVEPSVLENIISAASYAPSWKNTQITRYTLVETKSIKEKIISSYTPEYNAKIINNAPHLLAVTYMKNRCGFERDGSYSTQKKGAWQMFDVGIAAQSFCLAAHEYGIGTVILGIFDDHAITELLEIPDTQELAALIAFGYADTSPEAPKRKSTEDLLSFK